MVSKEEFQTWKEIISLCKDYAEKRNVIYNEVRKMYGWEKQNTSMLKRVPTIFRNFSTMLPLLFSRLPKVDVKANNEKSRENLSLMKRIVDYILRLSRLEKTVREVVLSAVLFGIGFMKVGYAAITLNDKEAQEKLFDEFLKENPGGSMEDAREFLKKKKAEDFPIGVYKEGIWSEPIEPQDLWPDPTAKCLADCRFIIHRIVLTEQDIIDRYGKKIAEEATASQRDYKWSEPGRNFGRAVKSYELLEIWVRSMGKKPGRVFFYLDGLDRFVKEIDWPHGEDVYPFLDLVLVPQPASLWGTIVPVMERDSETMITELVNKIVKHAKEAKSGLLYEEGALSEGEIGKLVTARNDFLIGVRSLGKVQPFQTTPLPSDVGNTVQFLEKGVEETSHTSPAQKQAADKRKKTATEVSIQASYGNVTIQYQVDRIDDLIAESAEVMIMLAKKHFKLTHVVEITQRLSNQEKFQQWKAEDIGEYSYSVKAGNRNQQDSNTIITQSMQTLDLVMRLLQTPQGQQAMPNPTEFIQDLLLSIREAQGANLETVKKAFEAPEGQQMLPGTGPGGMNLLQNMSGAGNKPDNNQAGTTGAAPGVPPLNRKL